MCLDPSLLVRMQIQILPSSSKKNLFLNGILNVTDKKGRIRIRIRDSVARIRGSRPEQNVTDPQQCLKTKEKNLFQNLRNNKNNVRNAINRVQYGAVILKKYDICRIEPSYSSTGKKPKSTTNIQCEIIL